ncbi:calcium-binding protein [Geminocystis sp. CENA526]|uniref:calcium-binding protein n=1 Tax=Geminocystis sp. CENA526 TaxID=1355871 RepID=UPI003D6EC4CF
MATFTGTNGDNILPSLGQDNSGDDIFKPLRGMDEVDGGDGDDILVIDYSGNTFSGDQAYNPGISTSFNDDGSGSFSGYISAYKKLNDSYGQDEVYFQNIERFRITGTNFNDDIIIGWNNDTVNAGGGDDYIHALEGIDSINGGEGIDTIGYTNLADATNNLSIKSTGATITTSNGIVIKNVEQFIKLYTGSGKDNIVFTERFDNEIHTGNGNDTINAGLGSDRVDGGSGIDTLTINYSSNTYGGSSSYPAGIDSDYTLNHGEGYNGSVSAYYNKKGSYDRIEFSNIEKLSIIGTPKNDYFRFGGG